MDVEVKVTGPLFDGRAEKVMEKAGREAEQAVADFAVRELRALIGRRAKQSTGRWAGGVVADRSRGDGLRVHRPGLRYTAWLQGTSRRNQRSSFKGYRLFQEAQQETEAHATALAGEAIGRRVKELE
jgi:hypothetical protein